MPEPVASVPNTRRWIGIETVTWIEGTYHRSRGRRQHRLVHLIPIACETIMSTRTALAAQTRTVTSSCPGPIRITRATMQ